jgi:hypothetical protein
MLGSFMFDSRFTSFCQSGWLVDFFLKKCAEVFVRNIFIYTSLFFSEKYIIEGLTKRIVDVYLSNTNRWFNFINFTHVNFFLNFLGFFFYSLTLLNLFLIFY